MKKFALIALAVALLAGSAQAYVTMTISVVDPQPIAPDSFFDVLVHIDTDEDMAQVQVVMDVSDPNLFMTAMSTDYGDLQLFNGPAGTASADFYEDGVVVQPPPPVPPLPDLPDTQTGSFDAMTLTFYVVGDGVFDLTPVVIDGSAFSTAVFMTDEYLPLWDFEIIGASVTVGEEIIPEPATLGLLALVALGSVVARKK